MVCHWLFEIACSIPSTCSNQPESSRFTSLNFQRFALIDKDRDGSVTVEEIYAVPSDNVEELLTPIAFEEDGERPEEDAAPGEEQGGDSSPATAHTEL